MQEFWWKIVCHELWRKQEVWTGEQAAAFSRKLYQHMSRTCCLALVPRQVLGESTDHGNTATGRKQQKTKPEGKKQNETKSREKKKKKECDETSNRNGYGALGQGLESAGRLQPGRSHESIRGTESTSRRAPSAPILPGVKTAGGSKRLSLLRSPREARAL